MALFSKKPKNVPRRRSQSFSESEQQASSVPEHNAFRRNRTLTGSASSRVLGASEAKAQLKSSRVQTHELARVRRHIGAVLLLVLCGSAVLYGLISQFTADVTVKARDVSVSLDDSYAQAIQSYLSSQPIERLRFLLNDDHLNEYMKSKAPEVAAVHVVGGVGFGKSAFTVTLRQPLAGWSIRGSQQYVDATGTAFKRNYFKRPSVQIVDNSGVQVEAGQAVASNRFLGFVGRAVGLAKTEGYSVTQVIIPANSTRMVELRLKGVSYPVKFSVDRPAGEQVEDMVRTIKWLQAHGQNPGYVDVRVGGRAYYR